MYPLDRPIRWIRYPLFEQPGQLIRMAQQAKDRARENYPLIDPTSLTALKRITAVKAEYFSVSIVSVHLVEAEILLFFIFDVTPQLHAL